MSEERMPLETFDHRNHTVVSTDAKVVTLSNVVG
jgi:hypothetical protein